MLLKNNIPKVWLSYNKILIETYIPDFSNEDYLEFKNSKESLAINSFLEEKARKVLENISKLTGIKWYRKELPIYLVPPTNKKSFSHPLVFILKGSLDIEQEFLVLCHEFVHVNMIADRDAFFVKNNKEERIDTGNIEAICWLVGKLALQMSLGDEWVKYQDAWQKILEWEKMSETKKEIEKLEHDWDYERQTLKSFLLNK